MGGAGTIARVLALLAPLPTQVQAAAHECAWQEVLALAPAEGRSRARRHRAHRDARRHEVPGGKGNDAREKGQMPVNRPPLLRLGGEEAFAAYQREFDRLYQSGVVDVLGRRVEFPPHACQHVCFKPAEEDRYGRLPREAWSQERAERIPWIRAALTDPRTEVRPSHRAADHQAYLLLVPADPGAGGEWERFGVYVQSEGGGRVTFLTAYPFDAWYWAQARRGGRRLYPAPEPAQRKRR